jgi:hypothetical protein
MNSDDYPFGFSDIPDIPDIRPLERRVAELEKRIATLETQLAIVQSIPVLGSLPQTPAEWLPHIRSIGEATRLYDRLS